MKRRLLQFCFALGLLVTLTAGVAVVRGFWASDWFAISWQRGDLAAPISEEVRLRTSREICAIGWSRITARIELPEFWRAAPRFRATHVAAGPGAAPVVWEHRGSVWRRLGFRIDHTGGAGWAAYGRVKERGHVVTAPTWFLALAGGAIAFLPARVLHRTRLRHRRRESGRCTVCGYDLRGAEHARCPECGAGVEVARV